MNVWTSQQIGQARGIRAKAHVDIVQIKRGGEEIWEFTRGKLFHNMVEIARTFALELDPRDLQFSKEDRGFEVVIVAWWEPQVTNIELHGGWKDGEQMDYRDAPQPIRFHKPPSPLTMSSTMDAYPTDPIEIADVYECVGWHEQGRRWVYRLKM